MRCPIQTSMMHTGGGKGRGEVPGAEFLSQFSGLGLGKGGRRGGEVEQDAESRKTHAVPWGPSKFLPKIFSSLTSYLLYSLYFLFFPLALSVRIIFFPNIFTLFTFIFLHPPSFSFFVFQCCSFCRF